MTDSKEQESSGTRVSALHELRAGLRPSRDLWPEIRHQITAEPSEANRPPARGVDRHSRLPAWLGAAAAAALLVAVGIWIGHGKQTPDAVSKQTDSQASNLRSASACVSDAQYQRERTALLSGPSDSLAGLPPESRQRILASLATVHDAVRDIETALARDSTNPLLQELLLTTCQDETRVLTEVQAAGSAERAGRGI